MAITHSFNNDANYTEGGNWFDDYGRRICQWQWDADTEILTVTCGIHGSNTDLKSFGEHQFTEENLKKRLPALAIETAGRINNTEYNV